MLIHLKNLLSTDEVAHARRLLLADDAPWVDGARSAGGQAVQRKSNRQLAQDSPSAATLRELVLAALRRDPVFFSAALPRRIFNPLFNRYEGVANHYGQHVDGAVLHSQTSGEWVRSDLSCTVFLTEPDDYDGGELVVHDTYGTHKVKLPAGHLVVYPATSMHSVTPVTRGSRWGSFFWTQSMVKDDWRRHMLYDLDMSIMSIRARLPDDDPAVVGLTAHYHNLIRHWAET